MAATKEAIAIVLDVGPGMNQAAPGEPTDLQTSIVAINMILQRKMFSESKDEICLILFGTPDTANELADGEGYENITVAQTLGMVSWQLLQYVQNDVQPSNVSADFLDAIVVAADHLVKGIQGKRGFASKRLILFSNLAGEFGDDNLEDIMGSLKESEIELNVIGPDLDGDDDDEDGAGDGKGAGRGAGGAANGHGKEKTPQQLAGETCLKHVLRQAEGDSYSFSEALPALSYFQSRQVRSTAWKCPMEIGTQLQIPICLYNRMKEAKPKSFKNVFAKDADAGIERLRTYHLNDEEETEIEKPDVVDGHRYGSTLVPFSSDDKEAMKFKSEKCFKVVGFTKSEHVRRHQFLGDATWICTAEKGDEAAAVALSAIIHAMYESNTVAVVRRVYANNGQVKMGCLVPHIKANYECLVYNELPFAEDVRQFTFGSLPLKADDATVNKKMAPKEDQLALMDELIDNMDLTKADQDDDGDDVEALKPKLTFNPYLQRLYQCLQHRALNPDDPLPELAPVVANSLKPPPAIAVQCQATIENMKKKFKLEKVAKKKDEETAANMFKDEGAGEGPSTKKQKLDGDLAGGMADLVKAKVTEVGSVNPVEDFKAILNQKDEDRFDEACKMMQKRILQLVVDSFGPQLYKKAMECLKVLREEALKNDEPVMFNDYMVEFKETLAVKGRRDFWKDIVKGKLTLISKAESEASGVSLNEAHKFLEEEKVTDEAPAPEPDMEAEDLLGEM